MIKDLIQYRSQSSLNLACGYFSAEFQLNIEIYLRMFRDQNDESPKILDCHPTYPAKL